MSTMGHPANPARPNVVHVERDEAGRHRMSATFRFAARVRPGASRTAVGGCWPMAESGALIVAVSAPAVDGLANEAVRRAVADAFGVRRRHVAIVRGEHGRDKLIELNPAPPDAERLLSALLDTP